MSYPENPETIILKNRYYPRGLREIDVWNHYQKVKSKLLLETKNLDLMVIIMADLNKPVMRRKLGSQTIRLTPQNYDEIITGRTLSIHNSMGSISTYGIIDVDVDPRDNFRWAIQAASDTYDFVMDKMPIVKKASIRFTGKTSFHIICDFERRMKVDTMKYLIERFLLQSDLARVYQVSGKRKSGVPNLDLDRNCLRCNHVALHSLSILGLQCMEVPYNNLQRFNPREAIVK